MYGILLVKYYGVNNAYVGAHFFNDVIYVYYSLPMPTWRKHKLMVNIQEKGGNVGRFDEIDRHVYGEINEARFKNLRKIQPSEKHRPK